MELEFTFEQLTPELIANILNSAYISTEVVTYEEGTEDEYKRAMAKLDNRHFQIFPGSFSALAFRSYVTYGKEYDEDRLRKTANYMDLFPIDTTYCERNDDGSHLMLFHYYHMIPEDETISAAYLVKLTRSFVKLMVEHMNDWEAIEEAAHQST